MARVVYRHARPWRRNRSKGGIALGVREESGDRRRELPLERQQALYIAKSRYSEVADGRIILPINRTMLIGLIVVMLTFWA